MITFVHMNLLQASWFSAVPVLQHGELGHMNKHLYSQFIICHHKYILPFLQVHALEDSIGGTV